MNDPRLQDVIDQWDLGDYYDDEWLDDEKVTKPKPKKHKAPKSGSRRKFTQSQTAHIRKLKQQGKTQQELADLYDTNQSTISMILNRKGAYRED